MSNELRPVTLEEQERMGLRRQRPTKYVSGEILPPARDQLPIVTHQVDLRVPQQAMQVVEVRTSAVDRAKGFSIETWQLSAFAALTTVGVLWWFADLPILSLGAVVLFMFVYTAVWFCAWLLHRFTSAEGVSLISALLMWLYLFRQQDINERERRK